MTEKSRNLEAEGEVDYDYVNDILFFKVKNREYDRSLDFNNFVIDIDTENYIVGIQIFDASKFLRMDKIHLRDIPNWKFQASAQDGAIEIRLFYQINIRGKIVEGQPIIMKDTDEDLPSSQMITASH